MTKAELRAYMKEAKRRPCMDCGVQYPSHCMEFDHVRGEKLFNIGAVGFGYTSSNGDKQGAYQRTPHDLTLGQLKREIAKCDVVCSNCHRIRKWGDDR